MSLRETPHAALLGNEVDGEALTQAGRDAAMAAKGSRHSGTLETLTVEQARALGPGHRITIEPGESASIRDATRLTGAALADYQQNRGWYGSGAELPGSDQSSSGSEQPDVKDVTCGDS